MVFRGLTSVMALTALLSMAEMGPLHLPSTTIVRKLIIGTAQETSGQFACVKQGLKSELGRQDIATSTLTLFALGCWN